MTPHRLLPAAVLALLALAGPARSQAPAPTSGTARFAAIHRACADETARFCGEADRTSGRNAAICLRPYQADLSAACRRAMRIRP